jgi:hypothetical protein
VVSQPVERVISRLVAAGYRALAEPVSVSSVSFDFAATLVGSQRALDLIVVVDTLVEVESRIRQKVEGLSRALDVVASRRPLTVILVGPSPRAALIEAISRVCRVLSVGTPTGPAADQLLSDALAVLLPLHTPVTSETIIEPVGEVRRRLKGMIAEAQTPALEAFLDASRQGADAVRDSLRVHLQQALVSRDGESSP